MTDQTVSRRTQQKARPEINDPDQCNAEHQEDAQLLDDFQNQATDLS